MGEHTRTEARPHDGRAGSLGELIHAAVRRAIEVAVDEELTAALGARPYERDGSRGGYRNGTKARTLTGPTGPLALRVPRARLFTTTDRREWTSTLLPRYQRRLPEVNEAVVATYLAGGNTRRLRGALSPLLKAAPLSKSAVSRIVGTLKAELEAWRTRSLADFDILGLYLDALALRVRSAGKVVSVPVLAVVAVLTDGQKQLVALELCPGGETFASWKGCLDDLVARGLVAPVWVVIDGLAGGQPELERLRLQARVWEPEADAMLERIGVQPGWHCIDLGCGAMGILGPLSRRVGESGRVVGIDLDAKQLEAARAYVQDAGLRNVEILES